MTSFEAQGTAAGGGVRFLGNARAYWRLLIRGAVLLMVTLGIYRFWLATDVRRFLWANTEIAGETLEYTGTALELLIGFLVAVAILIPVYAAFFLAALDLGTIGQMSGLIGFLALGVLGQYAVYRARRYRLTRTIYRGLRFSQGGSAWTFAFRAVLWWIASRPQLRSGLSVSARQPGTLQDAQYLLRRPGRTLRSLGFEPVPARPADVVSGHGAARGHGRRLHRRGGLAGVRRRAERRRR